MMRSRTTIQLAGCLGLALLICIGCSDDDDPVTPPPAGVTETIGAAGGSLTIPGELTLTIPQGALGADVEFVAKANASPPAAPTGFSLLSPVYSIEPSGTQFGEDVTLRLDYDDGALGGVSESDVVIFTDDGSGWEELRCSVYEADNYAETDITHLSDFVAAAPAPLVADDVYVDVSVARLFTLPFNKGPLMARNDAVIVEFAEFTGGQPGRSLQAASVAFGAWDLIWDGDTYYEYFGDPFGAFLTIGSSYGLVVVGNETVPALEISVPIMDREVFITNLAYQQVLPLTGFDVEWSGAEMGETVELILVGVGSPGVSLTVPNIGSYAVTGADLSSIGTGPGSVSLFWDETLPIEAEGYVATSHVTLSMGHNLLVNFAGDTVIDNTILASTPGLFIPDGPSGGGPGTAAIDVISSPAVGAIDSVRVYLDITHQWPSDLIVRLTSPDGTQLRVLFIGEGGEPEHNVQGWYPGDYVPKDDLNGFDGEASSGDWTLTAQDYSNEQTGVLNEWRLQIFYAH
jgi:hypothetical protein